MQIRLHKNTRASSAFRQALQESELSERVLARKHGISRTTIRKWKRHSSVEDTSHRPHTLLPSGRTTTRKSSSDR
jgi:DNA-binding transcriptional regulator YiaG